MHPLRGHTFSYINKQCWQSRDLNCSEKFREIVLLIPRGTLTSKIARLPNVSCIHGLNCSHKFNFWLLCYILTHNHYYESDQQQILQLHSLFQTWQTSCNNQEQHKIHMNFKSVYSENTWYYYLLLTYRDNWEHEQSPAEELQKNYNKSMVQAWLKQACLLQL